ncbi:MAG: flavodoxin family protein, partial [Methanospirillum sp.]|uniref:flavodoxin family protein n=1 Tax=Methanospirillum sp. TaxID=45200 RepID=UPI00236A021F
EVIMLNDLSITGCQACYACKQEDTIVCPILDDMQRIYQLIEGADGVIVATPIYFGGVTAQTKLWLDRLFPYLTMDLGSHLPRKIPLSCIYTQNQPDASYFTGAMNTFEFALGLIGFSIKNRVIGVDLDTGNKPMATEYPELMKQAWQVGTDLMP